MLKVTLVRGEFLQGSVLGNGRFPSTIFHIMPEKSMNKELGEPIAYGRTAEIYAWRERYTIDQSLVRSAYSVASYALRTTFYKGVQSK